MGRLLRLVQSGLLALALLGVVATPAFAISWITNSMTISPQTFANAISVNVKAKTVYDQIWVPPTVYASNFVVAINYRHLRTPQMYYQQGLNDSYVYKTSIGLIDNDPGYYLYNQNALTVLTPITLEANAWFKSYRSSCTPSSKKHFHGQTDKWWNSSGADIWIWTTTKSC